MFESFIMFFHIFVGFELEALSLHSIDCNNKIGLFLEVYLQDLRFKFSKIVGIGVDGKMYCDLIRSTQSSSTISRFPCS